MSVFENVDFFSLISVSSGPDKLPMPNMIKKEIKQEHHKIEE